MSKIIDTPLNLVQVRMEMQRQGYITFEEGHYNLNIVGIRNNATPTMTNRFDDWLVLWFNDPSGLLCCYWYRITTDPGKFYLATPMTKDGCAIMKPGQYKGAYSLGDHKGQPALKQMKPITVYRDRNRDNVYDYKEEQTGLFGVDIHRSGPNGSIEIDKWSAGCQVFSQLYDFEHFLAICNLASAKWGNHFTYTLLDGSQFQV